MAADWLTRLGRKGFETLVDEVVHDSVDRAIQSRVDPRFSGLENRMAGLEDRMTGVDGRLTGVESRLAGIESRLDIVDRLARLEAEINLLKSK